MINKPSYSIYTPVDIPKVEHPYLKSNLADEGFYDLSDWAETITPEGNVIAKGKVFQPTTYIPTVPDVVPEPYYSINNNEQYAKQFFLNKAKEAGYDLKDYQAAAIVGNFMLESGGNKLKIDAVNPTSKAYGTALWLGPRKTKLFEKYGENPTLLQQLEYAWWEMTLGDLLERNAFKKLLETKDLKSAVDSFAKNYERMSEDEYRKSAKLRLQNAQSLIQ